MENNQQQLTEFNFIIAVDASGSMSTEDVRGRSRWAAMQETAEQFARDVSKFDSDGIDVVVFGGMNIETHRGVTTDKVREIFTARNPRGSTPLAEALTAAFDLAGASDKKAMVVVFTDGVPDDKEAAANLIRGAANKQETDDQLTVLFVQVGYDAAATSYLRQLDNNLAGCKFDIVDAITIEEADQFASTTDMIIAAING